MSIVLVLAIALIVVVHVRKGLSSWAAHHLGVGLLYMPRYDPLAPGAAVVVEMVVAVVVVVVVGIDLFQCYVGFVRYFLKHQN